MRTGPLTATLFSGSLAAVLSSVVLLACGRLERGRAMATHNGPSQWLHGTQAGYRRGLSVRHTLAGFLIHHASSCWWAWVHGRLFSGGAAGPRPLAAHLREGAATAVLANVVDYRVMPERLQPGFEKHVSRVSLFAVYAAFGVGLALGSWLLERKLPPPR